MEGIFYGVGVGPGDPELLTLKAIRIIEECKVLAVPVSSPEIKAPVYEEDGAKGRCFTYLEKCAAYQIVLPKIPSVRHKPKLYLPMPMMKDKEELKKIHEQCTSVTAGILREGKDTAFITLGDPGIYSTCLYVHKRLKENGFTTKLIPGVPSFCAAAARLDEGLAENKEELHIIPASYGVEESLKLPGTKVLMKAGKKMPSVKQAVRDKGLYMQMVENCGMPGEHIYRDTEDVPDDAGYYSLMIIKEKE